MNHKVLYTEKGKEMKRAYTLLFDGYADWELGHVLAELRRYGNLDTVTVGFSDKAVTSMGGLRVIVDMAVSDMDVEDVLLFILPGGHLWEGAYPKDEVEVLLHRLVKAGAAIAAICAATTVLSRAGLLRGRKHTSNSLKYLAKMDPEYSGQANYINSLATRDRRIVTSSGLGSVDFTMEIFKELDLATPQLRTIWYNAFKHGNYPDGIEGDA